MNLKSTNKVETNRYELEIEVGAEEFEKALDKSFRKEAKKITIPGFRKGKAPRAFIEKYYGKEVFYEGAINSVYPAALDEAVKEAELDVINDEIGFDIVEAGENGLIFKATVTVKPEVKIEGYKGLEVKAQNSEVKDEDVDIELNNIRERNARLITVADRAAEKGDIAVIDFEGFVDGVAFKGGKAENHNLELGSGQFINGFEDQIVGHNINDEFDVVVTFPEEYQAKELAGKEAVFKVKLHEIKKRELPEVDDEFVKDVSEFDTIAEYREDLKKQLEEAAQAKAKDAMENELISKLVELVEADVPEAMYKNKIKEIMGDFSYRLQAQGLDMKTYMKYTGLDEEKFAETFRPQAERQVKLRLALEKIVELENITPTDEDLEKEYNKIAEQYHMEAEKVKGIIPGAELIKDIAVEKAIDIVREAAVTVQ